MAVSQCSGSATFSLVLFHGQPALVRFLSWNRRGLVSLSGWGWCPRLLYVLRVHLQTFLSYKIKIQGDVFSFINSSVLFLH